MAPAIVKDKTTKKNLKVQDARPRLKLAIEKLQKDESNKENQERIAFLEAQLQKKDEELEQVLSSQVFEKMDIDMDDNEETEEEKATSPNSPINPPAAEVKSEPTSPLFIPNEEAESDEEKPLFSRPGPATGQQVKTVGWTANKGGYYINMYGKKNAAKYRLEKYADSAEYEDELPADQNISNSQIRFGDAKNPNGKFKYTKRHIAGLYGVAWNTNEESVFDAMKPIDPDLAPKPWPSTYILVAWDIDGQVQKKWEPRATLRNRWGKKEADIAIYKAAVKQECRYEEVTTGRRPELSRSPSVGLVDDIARTFRQQSVPVRSNAPGSQYVRFSDSEQLNDNRASARADSVITKEAFIASYCDLAGAATFDDLASDMQQKCVVAWIGVQPKFATV